MRLVLRILARFIVIWLVTAIALGVTARLLPGISISGMEGVPAWVIAMAAAFVLGLMNLFIRPIILLLAVPLGFIAVFVVGFFVNAIILRITANVVSPGMVVDGWIPAIVGGIILALISAVVMAILNIDDSGSFYEGVVQRRLTRQGKEIPENPTLGLVMLEIDGLSYHHIHKAIDEGYMPHVKEMIEKEGYVLSHTDCGLPSQTSACQTGILFGDNYDIPAFRWYDKSQQRLFVSGSDAAEINGRYAKGQGLLRGGASVNNMMNGDAEISLLTAADLRGGTPEQKRARARDVYLLLLNPNFFMRVLGLFIGESILEVWQYFRDVMGKVEPRLNRLHKGYPFIRAATTVFMREVSGSLTLMQIMRGEAAIYTTWPGYDEVAHHSGPWSKYAFGVLRGFDEFIGDVREAITERAPRPYEFLLLSDHGQSFGPTFLMRYGYTLKDFIQEKMPQGTVIAHSTGGDDGMLSVTAMAAELGNVQEQDMGGTLGKATAKQMQKAAQGAVARQEEETGEIPSSTANVTFCGSGNLAQIYFHAFPKRTTITDLNTAYPGMVDAVVQHEGVGLVVVADDEGVPIVFGKQGARNLHTDEVTGEDPLLSYGDPEVRAWQLRRVADFPSAGDMIAISTLYPDGTVAAMEELIGNHGGLGGEQTDSFLLHPADLEVPPTRNSIDMFHVLNARREMMPPPKAIAAKTPARDDWAFANLLAGIAMVKTWVVLAFRAAFLNRPAYRIIADNGLMTGPALLLSIVGVLANALFYSDYGRSGSLLSRFVGQYILWFLLVAILHAVARVLRGDAQFTQTFRVMGFVHAINLLHLLGPIPVIGALAAVASSILTIFATWLGVAEAHHLRGWRTLLFPVLYASLFVIAGFALGSLLASQSITPSDLLQPIGGTP